MDYVKTTLPNGLRVIVVPMPTLQSATITIWVGTGSRYEEKKVNGISHFLEHMVFKGGKKYKTAREVSEAVDAIGGEFNAGTSKEWTNFYIRSGVSSMETAFDVLTDMVFSPHLSQKDIDREKGVIIEEINMYEDTPTRRVWDLFESLMFKGNPLAWDIAGTKEIIKSINRKDFVDYREKYYYPENIIITIAGGVTKEEGVSLVEKFLGELPKSNKNSKTFTPFTKKQTGPRVLLSKQKREQGHMVVGFFGYPYGAETRYTEAVLEALLGNGMSSRLFTEVREKRGLAYSVRCDTDNMLDTGYIASYAGVDPKKGQEALKVILNEYYRLTTPKHGLTKKELKKAKEFVKGHFALSLESTKAVNFLYGYEELMLGQIRTPEEVISGIDRVTGDEVLSYAKKLFDPQYVNLTIIGPYKSKEPFEKIIAKA